ncbi:DoxX family protein [Candidatus Woesearchaeota archaeon]|nr:MAG: DoxX family protein [Candidatus Woesearchaeota archaeon]
MFDKTKCEEKMQYFYPAFRILIGVLFMYHGYMKFPMGATGIFLVAGIIELIVGALLIVGFMSRYAAMLGAANMVGAWFIAHVPNGWNPLTNGGEPALLFFAAFLAIVAYGSGSCSLKKWEPW